MRGVEVDRGRERQLADRDLQVEAELGDPVGRGLVEVLEPGHPEASSSPVARALTWPPTLRSQPFR